MLPALLAMLALALSPVVAEAQRIGSPALNFQNTSRGGVGLVINAPQQFLGASGLFVTSGVPGGLGLYLDFKSSHNPPNRRDEYDPAISIEQAENVFGDTPFRNDRGWTTVNVAGVRPLTPELMLYAGAGLARASGFRQYHDPAGDRGQTGFYWVDDPEATDDYVNLLGGALIRGGTNLIFQIGGETAPAGVTVGGMFAVPF